MKPCAGKAPNAAGLRKRPTEEKAKELASLSIAITAYTARLDEAPIPAVTGVLPAERSGQPGPPGAGLKPLVPQPAPASKPPKGKKTKEAKGKKPNEKKPNEKKPKEKAKKSKKVIPASDDEESDEESEESEEEESDEDKDDSEEGVYIVEAILGERAEGKVMQYLVKWEGFDGEDTWEPASALKDNCVFKAYKKKATTPAALAPAALPPNPALAERLAAEPPAAQPAAAQPAAAKPAAVKRAAVKRAAAERAAAEPPAAEPPAAKPPAAEPGAAERPAAEPGAAEPGAAKPAAAKPAAAKPAAAKPAAAKPPPEISDHPMKTATKPATEALAEIMTASQVAFVAPVARRVANELPAKRQRKGGAKRFAHIELDDEDGPPQIRSLPLEAGPFAGVWVPDGDKFEIIGDLINDSVAGEIYQQVLYRCTSGYIKSKYICYEKEN